MSEVSFISARYSLNLGAPFGVLRLVAESKMDSAWLPMWSSNYSKLKLFKLLFLDGYYRGLFYLEVLRRLGCDFLRLVSWWWLQMWDSLW
jgi:hypothetical protein